MYLSYYFANLFKVHPGPFCLYFLSSFDTSLRRSVSFVLHFPVRPYSGLVSELSSPPIYLLMCPARLEFRPLVCVCVCVCVCFFFLNTRCVFQHLGLLEKILRAPLCSWGFPLDIGLSDVFFGVSKVIWVTVGAYAWTALRVSFCSQGYHI